jgi:tetratricopeptide (TPR) repeat protein
LAYGATELAAIHATMMRGDLGDALGAIEAAAREEPGNAQVRHLEGVIRRRAGDHAGAVRAFEAAIAAGLDTPEIANSRALSLQDLGRAEEALVAFDGALRRDPGYMPARVNRARLLAELGRLEEAERALIDALQDEPDSALARNALAATLRDAGRPADAAANYRETLRRDPANAVAAIRLGQALREAGRPEDAVGHYRANAARHAGSPEFAESHAGALLDSGDAQGAAVLLESLVAGHPSYFAGHRALARLAREYGVGGDPYRSYRTIAANWPGEAAIWHDWTALMLSFRDYSGVMEATRRARQLVGEPPALALTAAIASGELGDGEESERRFAKLEGALGETPAYLVARARNALRRGEPEQAAALAERATQVDPTDQFALAYLGTAWRLLGDEREFWLHDYAIQIDQTPLPHLQEPGALEALNAVLRGLHTAAHHPPDQSLRGGTQTEGALFSRAEREIVALREGVRAAIGRFANRLPVDEVHPFYRRKAAGVRFTGSWSVRLHGSGYHIAHVHDRGWISSALHLVVPPRDAGEPADAGCLALGAPPVELGLELAPRRVIRPQVGSLVLFPSSMWHGTAPFAGGEERLTVAFDALPLG